MKNTLKTLLATGLCAASIMFPTVCEANGGTNAPPQAQFCWTPSVSPGVTNVRVYWSTNGPITLTDGGSTNWVGFVDVGTNTCVLSDGTGFARGQPYHFNATAWANGLESIFYATNDNAFTFSNTPPAAPTVFKVTLGTP